MCIQFKENGAGGVVLKIFGWKIFEQVVQVVCYNQYFGVNGLLVVFGEIELEGDVVGLIVWGIVVVDCCWLIDVIDDEVQVVIVVQVVVGIVVVECWSFEVLVLVLVGKLQVVFIVEEGVVDWGGGYNVDQFFQYFFIFVDYGVYVGFIGYVVEVIFIEQVGMDIIVDEDVLQFIGIIILYQGRLVLICVFYIGSLA